MARKIVLGVFGAIGGIFCNLVAAIVQPSLGTTTALQLVSMVIGILAMIILASVIDSKTIRTDHQDTERRILLDELRDRRSLLKQLRDRHRAGVPIDVIGVDKWLEEQQRIRVVKERLRSIGCPFDSDPIDETPPPKIGCLYRFILVMKQALRSLYLVPFLIALTISFVASPWIQQMIIDYMEYVPKPKPILIETPTPSNTPSVIFDPVPTSTPTAMVSPSPTLASTISPPDPESDASIGSATDAESSVVTEQLLAQLSGCIPGRRIIEPKNNDEFTIGDIVEVWGELGTQYPYSYYEVGWAPGTFPDNTQYRILFRGETGAYDLTRFGLWDTRDLKPEMTYTLRLRLVMDNAQYYTPECTVAVRFR